MLLVYENKDKGISAEWKKTVHMSPHLHEAIEVVYVTNGNIALGVGMELYNMDEGDFAIVFPNVIHHYQVFDEKENKAIFLYIDPAVLSGFLKELQIYSPKNPVLKKENVHPDVVHAIKFLMQNPECTPILAQAYAQIILAYVFTEIPMIDKKSLGSNDLIYNSVEYIAKNFRDEISLEKMAFDLGISKYSLRTSYRHLCAGMKMHSRKHLPDHLKHTQILNNHRIQAFLIIRKQIIIKLFGKFSVL